MSTSLIFRLVALSVDLDQARAFQIAECPELAKEYSWRSTGGRVYLLAGETGDNRTFDINDRLARNWQIAGIGDQQTLITEACRTATDCEGGMLRFANSNWTSPENYIAAIRKALKEATPIEAFRREDPLDLLVVPAAIEGGDDDWARAAASAYARNGYLQHLVRSGAMASKVVTQPRMTLFSRDSREEEVLPHYRVHLRLDGSGAASAVLAALADIPDLVWHRSRLHQGYTGRWDAFLEFAHTRRKAA